MQMREMVGKSRNTVFFRMIWSSGGSKSRLAKAAGAKPSGQMSNEKVHAVVARSTFRSQNVQNTPAPDHFWKLRRRKSARRCGAKHISKSKCTRHQVRTTFGSWDVEKVHAVVARSTFRSQNAQNTPRTDHFCVSRSRRKGLCTFSKVSKTWGFCRIFNYNHHFTPHYTPIHYTTTTATPSPHSTTLHSTTLHTLHTHLHYTALHYTPLHSTTLHYTTLHYTPLHYTTTTTTQLHSTTLNYTTLHYTTLHSTTLHYTTLHYTTLRSTTLHSTTLHSTTLHYANYNYYNNNNNNTVTLQYTTLITLHYTRLHYATLHYTEWHCTTDRQVDR